MQCGLFELGRVNIHHHHLGSAGPCFPVIAHLTNGKANAHSQHQIGILHGKVAGAVAHIAAAPAIQRVIVLDQIQ